jgi:hypothetical protein
MAATITVEILDAERCRVVVTEGGSRTTHEVGVAEADWARLTGRQVPVEELVRRSFEFLLEREPKESILRSFDLPVIGRYFPEYEREIRTGSTPP